MAYYLTTQGMRIVETNDRGNLTYQREYTYGEEVDTDHMDPARVESLVESGDLSEEDPRQAQQQDRSEQAARAAGINGPVGAEAVDAHGTPVTPTGVPGEGADLDAEQTDGDGESVEDVDEYSSMDYSELQSEAKEADPPIAANQSAEELRAALRAQS